MREFQCTLIRHGKTAGNRERRYMGGRTDEPLLPEERQFLQKKKAPEVTHVFVIHVALHPCQHVRHRLFDHSHEFIDVVLIDRILRRRDQKHEAVVMPVNVFNQHVTEIGMIHVGIVECALTHRILPIFLEMFN